MVIRRRQPAGPLPHPAVVPGTVPLDETLNLPPRPTEPPAPVFPLVACLAPLGAAGVIWMVTGSAFALLFGLLSPIIAIGSLVDGRRSRRRQGARDAEEYDRRLRSLREIIADRHDRLRLAARAQTPGALAVLPMPAEAGLWSPGGTMLVSLGRGRVASGVHLGGASDPLDERDLRDWAAVLTAAPLTTDVAGGLGLVGPPAVTRALARGVLVQLCFALPPDAGTLAVPPGEAWSWAQALPHRADTTSAGGYRLLVGEVSTVPAGMPFPPQPATPRPSGTASLVPATGSIYLAAAEADLPRGCMTVVRVFGPQRAEIVRSPVRGLGSSFEPELITGEDALAFARVLRHRARTAGLLALTANLPVVVPFATLLDADPTTGPTTGAATAGAAAGLSCPVGVTAEGPLIIDLVSEGPHAVVGGTTGSGKSELLVTWVASMAARYGPAELTFLLVDFKGGAAFGPLAHLPHCVGVITDLDAVQATRPLESLAAELRHRESVLRDAGVRDVRELPRSTAAVGPLPRLVIVVDEFATMLAAFPALHALFVDIAARGRSLGVHLILCTQRPSGVVRDALLANCSLRLSLRVNNRADSDAVIGTDAAASLPASVPGRCLVSTAGGRPVLGQIASATPADLVSLAARSGDAQDARDGTAVPRRPWLDPLPRVLLESDLSRGVDLLRVGLSGVGLSGVDRPGFDGPGFDGPGVDGPGVDGPGVDRPGAAASFRLGLLDEPDRQRYRLARYSPATDGHLLVLGDAGSGKTSLLNTLARQGSALCRTELVVADIEQLWDALVAASRALESGTLHDRAPGADNLDAVNSEPTRLLLLDDVDSVYARWNPEHQLAALDMLSVLLRDGPARGLSIALTVQRLNGGLRGVATLVRSRLLLSVRDRDDYRDAGGLTTLFDERLPPGGGQWQGARLQLVAPEGTAGAASVGGSHAASVDPAPELDLKRMLRDGPLVVVSGAPARTITALRGLLGTGVRIVDLVGAAGLGQGGSAMGGAVPGRLEIRDATAGTVIVGDADAWQGHWMLFSAVRARSKLVFDGCSAADLRQLTHRRDAPPLLPGRSRVWVLSPDGWLGRYSLTRETSRTGRASPESLPHGGRRPASGRTPIS